ncbi:MAG: gfo/Idh/MocA family oxidoreductase, partial [Candidatus Marinimicrobia bacterium]|nr:gfo/Idh/MocA family oxidoreductase [Candidatus Neomarinimicrobiota bacterium]
VTEQDKNPENWRVNPEISGCGYFCDLASHQLNLLQYLIGPIKKVRGLVDRQAAAYPAEDAVSYQILTDNKIHINGIWNFASFKNNDQSVIVGDKGQIEFSTFENNPIVLETGSQKQEFHIEHLENIQFPLIETMVNEMRGEGECPSNGDSAAETSRLMDAILDRLIWI